MAWPLARAAVLLGCHDRDREEWSTVLATTKASFKRSYEGISATDGDLAAGRLEAAWH